jgi:3-phenylpropionate/cinnamic acid dioxygenase small subunit
VAARPSDRELTDFVYREARLIDEKRFEEWYELFTDDARYWMPLTRGQPQGETHTSLFYEDKLLLKVRIARLRTSNAFSQQQPSFCQHILQQPHVEEVDVDSGRFVVRTPFMYVEAQLDRQLILAAVAWHHLVCSEGSLRIRMKKIELLNRDAALPSIQLFL